jgi:hypothetical protein
MKDLGQRLIKMANKSLSQSSQQNGWSLQELAAPILEAHPERSLHQLFHFTN